LPGLERLLKNGPITNWTGSNGAICGSIKSKMTADGYLRYIQNGHNFATGLPIPIYVMFGSRTVQGAVSDRA